MPAPDDATVKFLYEIGTLRGINRAHRQTLFSPDNTDSIAAHSFRVALIAWCIAEGEGLDPYKAVMMGLLHDAAETRSGDHNWVHKRYVKINEAQITSEQLAGFAGSEKFLALARDYAERTVPEAVAAKDADLIDQILLLREYELQGNQEAMRWLSDKELRLGRLKLPTSRRIGESAYAVIPSEWHRTLWTDKNL